MKKREKIIITALLLCMTIIQVSCEKEEPEKVASALVLVSGDNQSAQVETIIPEAIGVIVKDQNGDAFGGAMVSFSITEGTLSASSAVTDSQGKVEVNWTLGSTSGEQELIAKAFKKDGITPLSGSPLTITATALQVPPRFTSLDLLSGNNQEAIIGTSLANPVEVKATDQYGEGMPGVSIFFGAKNGSVSLANTTTNSQGIASADWTLGSKVGEQELVVMVLGVEGAAPDLKVLAIGKPQTVSDMEGNIYNYVVIGTQTWMAENLRSTKYDDGTDIPNELNNIEWSKLTSPAFCWYNNDEATYKIPYGGLYNWYAINPTNNGDKNVCPTGWRVPSFDDWMILINYLGGTSLAGYKLKEADYEHWIKDPYSGGSNEVGFAALPGGMNDVLYKKFNFLTYHGFYWTTSSRLVQLNEPPYPIAIQIHFQGDINGQAWSRENGMSVRCIKD